MSKINVGDKVKYWDSLIRQTITGFTVVGRERKRYLVIRQTSGNEFIIHERYVEKEV